MTRKKYLKVSSPAKINLALAIGEKRPDWYHNITSVFQQIDLADELTFVGLDNTNSIRLTASGLPVPTGPKNLVVKAARLLQKEFRIAQGARIHLKKRLPLGAGLGGGSSNAAATIKALVKLWGIKASRKKLTSLAAKLGADVPFFLIGGTAEVSGKGEIIRSLPKLKKFWLVLAVPQVTINTTWAYQAWDEVPKPGSRESKTVEDREKVRRLIKLIRRGGPRYTWEQVSQYLVNSFEAVVLPVFPKIGEIKARLGKLGALAALMTGSGSAVFGIFGDHNQAARAYRALAASKMARRYLLIKMAKAPG